MPLEIKDTVDEKLRALATKVDAAPNIAEVFFTGGDRTPREQMVIAMVQRSKKRDPWFLSTIQRKNIKRMMDRTVKAMAAGQTIDPSIALRQVARFIAAVFVDNINKGRSRGGVALAPDTPGVAKRKMAKLGHSKPLIDTGSLRDSISSRIK